MRKILVALCIAAGLAMSVPADAAQFARVNCTAATTGGTPTEWVVQRLNATDENNPVTVATLPIPGASSFDDVAAVGPVRYRCGAKNGAGIVFSDPSAIFDIVEVPGKPGVTVIIISQ